MLHIITGKINSYKTTRMKEIFKQTQKGDGFVSIKTMKDHKVLYYELENLQSKTKQIHVVHTVNYPNHFTNYETLGPYAFDLDYLSEVEQYIEKLISNGIEPIFLDEIGILETNNKYFYPILKKIIDANIEAYITVRSSLVEKIIDVFDVTNYTIIE